MKRPPVNSLNLEFMQEIRNSLVTLEQNKKCRGLILTSVSLYRTKQTSVGLGSLILVFISGFIFISVVKLKLAKLLFLSPFLMG